jgi:heme oxygenase
MLMTELRAATQPMHDALERRLNIIAPNLSRERYFRILRRFYGFYAPLESAIAAYGTHPSNWLDADRRKLPLLSSDLQSSGMSNRDIAHLPHCRDLEGLSDPTGHPGCMYVLEGATLGGQLVTRHVKERLGLTDTATRFFNSYGSRVGAMWKSFCGHVETIGNTPAARARIIASACATFGTLDRWLSHDGGL